MHDGAEPGARGALDGIRILDLTSVVMGPFATQQLGDLGADVILVESLTGSTNRRMGPGTHTQFSGTALNLLRNKRSVALDVKTPGGLEALKRILATCEVLVTNLRPAPLARLKLTFADAAAIRPGIIYCHAQGFRTDSGRGDDPAFDDIIQAESGLADTSRRMNKPPAIATTILADKVSGMAIVQGVLAALLHRARTGEGQRVEIPMLDVMQAFVLVEHGAGALARPDDGPAGHDRILIEGRGPQRTSDGWVCIMPYSTATYAAIFRAGGREDLIDDRRTHSGALAQNAEFLFAKLHEVVATRTTAEWLAICKRHQVPVGAVPTLEEVAAQMPIAQHPHAGPYRALRPPIVYSRTPAAVHRPAPLIGEHTRMVLEEAGYEATDIEALADAKAIGIAGPQGMIATD
jgi:crotonobetainyl-CoA:carnitine CoA-transferase CaiB-like acyl-CoA transferase